MTDDELERWRVSYHEGGHACAARLLRGRISGPVSIQPTKRWSGVAYVAARRPTARDLERTDLGLPMATFPARMRHRLETDIIIYLAGNEAEMLRPDWWPATGYVPEPKPTCDDRLAERAAAALTGREIRLLARGRLRR
jgi:hypothetical protein